MKFSTIGRRTRFTLITLALLVTALPYLLPRISTGGDYPKHLLVSAVIASYQDSELGYSAYFERDIRIAPTIAPYLILAALMKICDPFLAGKIYFLLLITATWGFSALFLRTQKVGDPGLCAMAVLPLGQSFTFHAGFLAYVGTLPLYALALWIWYSAKSPVPRFLALGATAVLLLLFHIVGIAVWAFTAAVIGIWQAWRNERRLRSVLLDALTFAPAVVLSAGFLAAKNSSDLALQFYPPLQAIKAFLAFNLTSLSDKVVWILPPAFAAFCLAGLWQVFRRRVRGELAVVAAALIAIGILMPIQIGAWWLVGPRTLPYAVIAGVGLMCFERAGRRVLVAASIVVLVAISAFNSSAAMRVQQEYDHFLSGAEAVELGSYTLTLVRDPLFPDGGSAQEVAGVSTLSDPFWGMGDAYSILRGGGNPNAYVRPHLKTGAAFLELKKPNSFNYFYANEGEAPEARYRGVGEVYDFVILYADADGLERVLNEEMVLVFHNEPLKIYRSMRLVSDGDRSLSR